MTGGDKKSESSLHSYLISAATIVVFLFLLYIIFFRGGWVYIFAKLFGFQNVDVSYE